MKRPALPLFVILAAVAALLAGCAVYPGNPSPYGYGDGYGAYDGYGYGYGYPGPPQSSLFLGFGGYSGTSYRDSYWGHGNRGHWNGGHGSGQGGPHGSPPPQAGGSGGGSGGSGAHMGNGGGAGPAMVAEEPESSRPITEPGSRITDEAGLASTDRDHAL